MAPASSARWMQMHRHLFGDRPLSELCIPGSHDAGTSRRSFGTTFGTESNVLTQIKSIFDQLELGVRRLDIRPMLANPSGETVTSWSCGHYTGEAEGKIGWQGANCVPIKEVVDDLNRFTKDNAELVIVDISHVYRIFINNPISSTKGSPSLSEWQDLFKLLAGINNRFTLERSGGVRDKPFQDYNLNQFIGNNQAAVVVLVDEYSGHDEIFQNGCWPAYMTNGQPYLGLGGASVTRMQSTGDAIGSTFSLLQVFGPEYNSDSVLSLSKKEQDKQFPWLLQQLASEGYPAVIYMDRIQNVDLLTFCLAVGYQRYNMAKGLHSKVVVYGGALVTDQDAHNAIQHAIDNGGSFAATNSSLRCDPWQGMTKSCAVFYEQDGIIKGRWAQENFGLHFELDVISVTYGPRQIRDQAVYLRLLKAIAQRQGFVVNNDSLGGDPQNGVRKTCIIRFRDMNDSKVREEKAEEGEYIDFETWVEKLGKAVASGHRWV